MTFGHQACDEALIKMSKIIQPPLRQSGTLDGFGGDEFIILTQSNSV